MTDPHANQEIFSVCLTFVYLSVSRKPHIIEYLIDLLKLERANASTISQKILKSLTHPCV